MRAKSGQYYNVDEQFGQQQQSATAYWKILAQLSVWMLLAGFLILPTTYDKDPQLRFNSGIVIIIVVAFLTGGYSLSALCWFACPSTRFRLENVFIPSACSSLIGLFGVAWALIRSARFDPTAVGCPVSIALTAVSAVVYATLALLESRKLKPLTAQTPIWPSTGGWQDGQWQDSNSAYHSAYPQSAYPLTALNDDASAQYTAGYLQRTRTEEDMVGQQMATLLKKSTPIPSPDASQATFRLEWPAGGDDTDDENKKSRSRSRARTTSGGPSLLLSPDDAIRSSRKNSEGSGTLGRISETLGIDQRGREARKKEKEKEERRRSREERRREIEFGMAQEEASSSAQPSSSIQPS